MLADVDGIAVEHLIAMGESQSAFRLLTYVNAVHPAARVYDGFLIHSRDGGGRHSPRVALLSRCAASASQLYKVGSDARENFHETP
jgi:hypothetical protein